MSARRTAALTATTAGAITALTLVGATTAAVAGSASPTPYRVTDAGIELPAGDAFEVHDHVNVTYTSGFGVGSRNVHIEGPGSLFGDLAGASALTWARAGLPPDACVTWVQVAGYDEHHGEGGQPPVCRTTAVTPAPTGAPTPGAPTPDAPTTPAPSAPTTAAPAPLVPNPPATTPTPTPATSPSSTPSATPSDAPSASAAPVPVATSGPTPTPTAEVVGTADSPAPTERSEVLAATDPTPASGQVPQVRAAVVERSDVLAATGAHGAAVLGVAALALALGTGLVVWRRRSPRP